MKPLLQFRAQVLGGKRHHFRLLEPGVRLRRHLLAIREVLLEVAQPGLERHHFRQPQGLVGPIGQNRVGLIGKGERAVPVALFLQGLLGGFDEQLEVVDLGRQLGVGRVDGRDLDVLGMDRGRSRRDRRHRRGRRHRRHP
jgi:hypothetical protein